MESLRTKIEEALYKLVVHRRAADFQRLVFHLASLSWPELRATTLSSDLGADALIPFRDGKTKLVLACGINGDLAKLKDDCRRLRETHQKLEEIVFATTAPVTEVTERKWREEIKSEFGIGLRDVIQREWITSELEKVPNRWLCKEYLEIPLTEFENLHENLPRIRRAAAKLLDARKDQYQFERHSLVDLSLEEVSTQTTPIRLSDFPGRLSSGDRCWISGAPGAGKTFSLITIAGEVTESDSLIPVFVSLRDLSHRGDKLLEWIASEPSFQEQGIREAPLAQAASAGKLLILLNGWNEIARDASVATTEAISSFIRQMPGCAVIVASRQAPDRVFDFPAREFQIKPLSGDNIRKALRQSGLEDADRHVDFILGSDRLYEIATVPLFLQAIIQEAKAGNELPLGKQAMLRRMVERAVEEHRPALEHGDVRQHAFRYLRDLAWDVTKAGRTTLPEKDARHAIFKTVGALKEEALLGEAPSPPDILEQLCAGHLLVSVPGNELAFTHQLIQEHFAATGITFVLGDALRREDLAFARESLTDYQWEQPLFLALEDLAEHNMSAEIRILLDWLRLLDFETACHMAGIVSDCWSEIRDLFKPTIRHLASLENVNARWLAARCGAATGQVEFHDLVWAALEGHPSGSSDCFEGISSTFLLRALGGEFADKLLQVLDEEFRFRALALVGRSPTVESLGLAEALAIRDPAPAVRRLAFQQLFVSGRRGWLRRFLLDAKLQDWSLGTLRVLKACSRCTFGRFRKFMRRYLESQTTTAERMNALAVWDQVDPTGASVMARAEYDRLEALPLVSQKDLEFRQFCLKSGARDDHNWAIPRLVRKALSPDGLAKLDVRLLNILPEAERTVVVEQLVPELARKGHTTMGAAQGLAELAPLVAGECLLRAIVKGARESAETEEQRSLQQLMHELNHATVVEAAMHADFETPSPKELRALLRAVIVGFPGGDPGAVQSLPRETLAAYRERLLHWLSLLPPLDRESASAWADCATLIGEVKHPEDAELLYRILREDEACVLGQIEKRRQEVEAYEASGRTITPPGPMDWISYFNWHIAALANVPGNRCMDIMVELLSDPDHIGVAAHTLARDVGAEPIDLSGSIHSSPRFDLIYKKRTAGKPLSEPASEYETAIKGAIDLQVGQHNYRSHALFSALCALARISGPDSESWILERLERYFPSSGAESLLETMTLAGNLLPGKRILPFVRNTITIARSEPWNNHDQTYLVTKALVSLFFSDSPELAIELLDGEVDWFLKSYQFRSLLGMLAWERSSVVEAWLKQLLNHEIVRDAVLECLAKRALTRGDHSAVLEVANRLAQAGGSMDPTSSAPRIICKLAADDKSFRSLLLAQAKVAKSINEAAGWLRLISGIGTNDGVRAAFELADRFGERIGVVSSLAPVMQEGTSLSFHGWFYFIGGARLTSALYYLPDIIDKLHEFTASPDPEMRAAAERALLWIERERILAGSPPAGPRPLTHQSKGSSDSGPWQLELHCSR